MQTELVWGPLDDPKVLDISKLLGIPEDPQRIRKKTWLGGKREFDEYSNAGYNMDKILEFAYFTPF